VAHALVDRWWDDNNPLQPKDLLTIKIESHEELTVYTDGPI